MACPQCAQGSLSASLVVMRCQPQYSMLLPPQPCLCATVQALAKRRQSVARELERLRGAQLEATARQMNLLLG